MSSIMRSGPTNGQMSLVCTFYKWIIVQEVAATIFNLNIAAKVGAFFPPSIFILCQPLLVCFPSEWCQSFLSQVFCAERQTQMWLFCLQKHTFTRAILGKKVSSGLTSAGRRRVQSLSEGLTQGLVRDFTLCWCFTLKLATFSPFSAIHSAQPLFLISPVLFFLSTVFFFLCRIHLNASFSHFSWNLVSEDLSLYWSLTGILVLLFVSLGMEEDGVCTLPTHYWLQLWKQLCLSNYVCVCVSVFQYLLHNKNQNIHSASKVRTFIRSEDIWSSHLQWLVYVLRPGFRLGVRLRVRIRC